MSVRGERNPLDKWLAYFTPLGRGRFELRAAARVADWRPFVEGTAMFGGRFWARMRGGHILYRRAAGEMRGAWEFVGRCDGAAESVTVFPWIAGAAGATYEFALSAIGAGGVEDLEDMPRTYVSFDADGAWVATAPNRVTSLRAAGCEGGRIALSWRYDETNQPSAPAIFELFNDAETPGMVDLETVVGTVAYRLRRGTFRWTSLPFAHGAVTRWRVRAVSADGGASEPSAVAIATAQVDVEVAPRIVAMGSVAE